MNCSKCGESEKIIKYGKYKDTHRMLCKNCRHIGVPRPIIKEHVTAVTIEVF